jgi:hypothetical protein
MPKTPAVRIGLYVTETSEERFYHVRATAVILGPTLWELRQVDQGRAHNVPADRIRNPSGSGESDGTALYLENLTVNSQGDSDARRLYGWGVEYRQVFSIDARKAALMVRTLTTIDRRMERADQKYGRAATFGSYLARVADAIGADAIVRPPSKATGWSYDDNAHQIDNIKDGIYQVDRMIDRWSQAVAS